MAQRLNKKLLLGLGSTLGFLGTGVVSGFGINAIVSNSDNFIKDQLAINALPEANFKEVPNYNVASRNMFIDTRDLRRFHFGNTQIGQTVTANGWLGVFDDKRTTNRNAHRIALTGWNGEIIWVNEDYINEANPSAFNVYDMKYDYNTNLIFVLRTADPRGISVNGSVPLTMDVLDAHNGQRVSQINSATFQPIQRNAFNQITNTAYFQNTTSDSARSKNLFQLDIASKPGTNEVLVTWMPNYMQLINNAGNLPDLLGFKQTFHNAMKGFLFRKINSSSGFSVSNQVINFPNMQNFLTISPINWQDPLWDFKTYNMKNYSLLANPFFTTDNGRGFILHLILGSNGIDRYNDGLNPPSEKDRSGEQILHGAFGFNSNWTENRNNLFVQQIGGDPNVFPPSQYHPDLNAYKSWPFKVDLHSNSWYKSSRNNNMVQANLRINKNMFDNNSLVFAYPYATGSGYPIYNVMQLNINQSNGRISYDFNSNNKKRSTNWEFGKNINDYFVANQNKYGNFNNTTGDINRIFPFPGSNNANDINHNYNRLISVSPFDNTFIYGAKSNLKYAALQPDNNANNNKYASFWVSSDNLRNNKPLIRPIVITNDATINNQTIDTYMTDVNSLYSDGFTFDPRSLVTRSNNIKSLNLYFNQNGTGQNDAYADNGFVSSKVGLLKDILSESNNAVNSGNVVWINNVASPYLKTEPDNVTFRLLTAGIDRDSYSTIIHSRANLSQWYTRSWTNSNRPGNMFARDQRLNETDASADRAIAKIFDNRLNDPDVNSNKAVDLVSAWKDKNGNTKYAKNPPNYNRLALKRPIIKIGSTSLGRNALSLVTNYELTSEAQQEVFNKPGWQLPAANRANFVLTKTETVNNVSYQIVSSWQTDYKMNRIYSDTGPNFNRDNVQWIELRQPVWLDKINQSNLNFGSGNNNVAKNQIQPLRLMLRLIRPTGTLPNWFDARFGANSDFFNKAYPIEAAYPNETTFKQMINEFANLKAQHIDLSDSKNANTAVGLGNMKIEAYLELNPKFANIANETSNKIYKLDDGKTKFLYDTTTGDRIIYKDDFKQERLIYDQSQIDYDRFQEGAFGQANSSLRTIIQKSWSPNALNRNFNIKVATDYDQLPDTLVRTTAGNDDPIFNFIYVENNTKLELTPTNLSWFKNRMENFNRLLNLFVQFEYQTSNQQNSNSWTALGIFLTDTQIKAKMKNGKLILDARNNSNQLVPNIKKLRFKLTTKGNTNNDPNLSIWQNNFQKDEAKYISASNPLAIENFVVQSSYISNTILTNNNQSINSLTKTDIDNFIEQVKNKSSTTDADLRAKVSLTFDYNNKANLNAQQLFDEIKAQRDGTEPFSLWNGTNGANRIRAKFVLLSTEGIQFVKPNGQTAADSDLSADVQANLKTEVDLTEYLNQLINGSLKLKNQPAVAGQMNGQDILFPANNAVSGYFATASFEEIKNKLESKLGVKVRFRAWNNQQDNWGPPIYNVNELKTYNVSRPEIGLSLEQQTNWNSKVIYNSTELGADNWFSLKLSLPKIIKNPNPNNTSQMIANFNGENIFNGNTWELNVGNNLATGKSIVIDTLIKASTTNPQDYNELKTNDALLVLEFKLGGSAWMQAANLKTELAKQTIDQNDNSLKMRVRLSNEDNFLLATDLANQEFNLLPNGNTTIKKWIHGSVYEAALAKSSAISLKPESNKNNLQYNYDNDLRPLFENTGRDGLVVQWRLGSNPNGWQNLKGQNNSLPNRVDATENQIYVRIAKDPNSNIYLYGPEVKQTRIEFVLDLSKIPTLIQINNNWFNELKLSVGVNEFLQNINAQHFTDYENQFFAKSASLNGNNNPLRTKVKLEYQFNKGSTWMNGGQMANNIKNKLNNFSATDQGVWVLSHDGSTYKNNPNGFNKNVYVINARVTTVQAGDPTIQFVHPDQPDQPINGNQLEGNLKSDIKTKVDLGNWLNEVFNVGINATRANAPGKLNPNSIRIPGKQAPGNGLPPVQFGGKDFNAIQTILNNVNVFVQYKKYDANAQGFWSGWLNSSNLVDSYNVQNPQIVIGFKTPNNEGNVNDRLVLNIKLFNGNTEFNNDTALSVKLNVPKLVKQPQNLANAIQDFNNQNVFGGNTFNLDVNNNKLTVAQNGFTEAIKKASADGARFDDLDALLVYEYQIMNSGSGWKSATELKAFLETKVNIDLPSNQLKMKVSLKSTSGGNSQYELDPNVIWEFELLANNNPTIKKYIHGTQYEAALNNIAVTGDFNNLIYTYPTEILAIINGQQNDSAINLKLQYTFLESLQPNASSNGPTSTDPNKNWVDALNGLPKRIDQNQKAIYVQIVLKPDRINNFVYGPDLNLVTKTKGTVDLNNIATLIQVDPDLFKQTAFIPDNQQPTFLEQLSPDKFLDYENRIYEKLGFSANHPKRQLLTLKYEFNGQKNLTADEVIAKIKEFQNEFDNQYLGILTFWNGLDTDTKGFRLNATFFTTNSDLIKFVDQQNQITNNLTGSTNTKNLHTKINLDTFIKNLITKETTIQTVGGNPGTISNFVPPAMPNQNPPAFLHNRNYDEIAKRLTDLGVRIVFGQDKGTNGQPGRWVEKNDVKTYDLATALLPFSFENRSNNLHLQIPGGQNEIITPNDASHNKIFNLKLNAPKQISIIDDDLTDFLTTRPFTGNTKKLTFSKQLVDKMIDKILARNAINNNDFLKAPLKVYFKLADLAYMEGDELVSHLATKQNDDVINRSIKFKFAIPDDQADNWLISPQKEYELYQENNNNPLKIYINDKNLHADLAKTTFSGNNKNLNWIWFGGINVDDNTGILQANNRGQGLKIEYTFNPNASQNTSDIKTGWVNVKPTNFEPQFNEIFVRLTVVDANKYVYDNDGKVDSTKKIALDLSAIRQIIDLESSWLNQNLLTDEIDIKKIDEKIINVYEEKVFQAMSIAPELKNKIAIKYSFNGNNNLDKNGLINAIRNYKQTNVNDLSLGILQLHNGTSGEEIKSQFGKAETNGNYDLNVNDLNEFLLDTSKVITTIDLNYVLKWLDTIKVPVVKKPNSDNGIEKLDFPDIVADQDEYFNTKKWNQFEQALNSLGIIIQYRSLTSANQNNINSDWQDGQNNINDYDPAIGKIQIRFKFNLAKTKNIKIKLKNNVVVPGTNTQPTEAFAIDLKIKLILKINNGFVVKFITTNDVVKGNTKFLEINAAAEEQMIKAIKQENIINNQEFSKANLLVQYQIGEAQIAGEWRDRDEFIKYLSEQQTDQNTNKIVFKFAIDPKQSNDFEVVESNYALTDHQNPGPNIKIKYYINEAGLENLANQVVLGGTNLQPVWNWPSDFNVNDQTSTIDSAPGKGLQVQYTLKTGPTYDEGLGSDITTSWVNQQPKSIPADVNNLWIRLKPLEGYVYGAVQPTVHKVNINLTRYIEVEETWLRERFAAIEIKSFKEQQVNAVISKILARISEEDLRNKVEIVFDFNGEQDLDAATLIRKIEALLEPSNNATFGILQLFNGNNGQLIKANFKIKTGQANYKIFNKTTGKEGTNYQDLETSQISTQIDLMASLNIIFSGLISTKQLANNQIEILMPDFPDNGAVLAKRSWKEAAQRLKDVGITVEYRAVNGKDDFGSWTENLTEVKTYDPTINQFNLRFRWDKVKAANVRVQISQNDLIGTNKEISEIYSLNLNLPLKLELDLAAIKKFVDDPITVFGNTKFLTITADKEEELINAIIKFNENNNSLAVQAAGRIEVQYVLGAQQTNWLNREAFQEFLKTQPDQTSNEIRFRFIIKAKQSPQDLEFTIDNQINNLTQYQAPAPNIKIPYFINKDQWELKADQIAITGDNHNIVWQWNSLDVNQNNLVQTRAGRGLKIQFSTKQNIQYKDPENSDLTQGWSNERPDALLVDSNDLYVRLVSSHNGFVYEEQQVQSARVHKVVLQDFKFLIQVDRNWLAQKLVIAQDNFVNNVQLNDLKNYESEVLKGINPPSLKSNVGLTYEFNGIKNLTKEQLFAEIQNILTNFNDANAGILQLDNGIQGLSIMATFIIQNLSDNNGKEYELFEINGESLTNQVNTTEIKTHIDLQPYIKVLMSQKIAVENANPDTGDLGKILMPSFPTGQFALSGKTFNQIRQRLGQLGIIFEGRALGNGVSDDWIPIENIQKYDPNNGKIELRLAMDDQKAKNIVLSVLKDKDQDIVNQPKGKIELILQVPLKVKIDQDIVERLFINNDSINGNTRFLTINLQNETTLITQIIEDNKQTNINFEKLTNKLKIEYQIKNSQEWKQLNEFTEFLKNTKDNWTSNQIKFRFVLINDTDNDFILENQEFILHPEKIGSKDAAVKLYIHAKDYETLADKISISGTSTNFVYNWPQGFPINQATGQVQDVEGLQIQYTTKINQANEDYNNGINKNPALGWVDQQVKVIDPVERYLAIQLVAKDGYVYGAQFKTQNDLPEDNSPNWKIHQIKTQAIISEIEIDMNALNLIKFEGQFPNINEAQITKLEEQAKKAATNLTALHNKIKFEYQISLNGIELLNFSSLANLKTWLVEYEANKSNDTAGLLKFNAGGSTQFVTITARLQAINPNEYVVLDKDGGTDFAAKKASADQGRSINTDQYVTIFDLQEYENVLLNQFVTLPNGANTNNISGFNPPGMESVQSNNFLAGKNFIEIKTLLEKLGLIIEYQAPDKNNNLWVSQNQISQLNDKNELLMRFRINTSANRIAANQLTIFANSFRLQTKTNPTGNLIADKDYATDPIKLKINLPILITVNRNDLIQEQLKLMGNTWQVKNVASILQEAQRLITIAKTTNSTANTDVTNADLKIQFQLPGLEENKQIWFEIETLAKILLRLTDKNWNTNEIRVRWWIDENQTDVNGFRYKISDPNEITLQSRLLDKNAQFKMYIHPNDIYSSSDNIIKNLKAQLVKVVENWFLFSL